ncbi:uncharacterized protein LOC143281636 [Babylonia areolata]|uniref:uncharacterized protein LOC143281636 n=1 Tax=Babylonia areolata TaxID=304850 RepID=UPI003FD32E4E
MEGAEAQAPPPVNNLLQPDVYNRLDAQARERTRVVNAQLDHRLQAQHSILAKYRLAAERYYLREQRLVRKELSRISSRLPTVRRIHDFRNKFLYGEGLHRSLSQSLPDVRVAAGPKKIRGVPEERSEQPFCLRYFIHHLPTKKKFYKTATPSSPTAALLPRGSGTLGETGDVIEESVTLPPLTGHEFPATTTTTTTATTTQKEGNEVARTVPIGKEPGEDSSTVAGGMDSARNLNRQAAATKTDNSPDERVRDDNRSARFSDEGRPSRRCDWKPPSGEGRRSRTLPPILRQNLRLAHSSPQLYQG